MSKKFLLLTCALGALSGVAGVASAADTPPPAATATEVGAVIITAEKREANLQKVPVAVTAFTRTQRDRTGIESLQDFTNYTPGLDYDAVDDHLFIRGVGRESINLGASSGVAAYIDGFYQPEPINAIDPPMFSQNVDVLRGPQGTLSGRNGIGGALFVTSSRPTSTPYAEARFTIGNYGLFDYEGAVSGPIVDGLNFRLSAYGKTQDEGYFKNVANGVTAGGVTNEYHIEGSATAKLGPNADLFVRAFSSDADNFAGPTVRASFSPSSITSPGATVLNQNGGSFFNSGFGFNPQAVNATFINPNIRTNPSTSNPYDYLSSQDYHNHVDNDANVNYIFTYHFPSVDLKYTGGYAQYDYTGDLPGQANTDVLSYQVPLTSSALGAGFDNPTCVAKTSSNALLQAVENCLTVHPGGLTETFQQKDAWWSQEAVLTSTTPGPLQWVAGVYYYHEQFANPQNERDPQQSQLLAPCDLTAANVPGAGTGGAAANAACSALGLFPLTSAPANPNGYLATSNYNLTDKSEAVFGQIDYKLNSAVKLTAGLRYTSDQKSGEEFVRAINFDNFQGEFNPFSLGSLVPAVDETNFACNETLTASNPNFNPAFNKPDTNQKGVVSACTINPVTGVASRQLGGNSSAVTGTAGVEWTPDSSTLAYIRYSRGYKDLALNMGNLATVAEVAPETMNDYELGWKKSFGHNLVIDAALFYEDYFNFQDNLSTFQPATQTFTSEFTNVARARSAGFELETIWTPIDNLLIHFSYSYDNSGYPDKCNAATGQNCFEDTANPHPTPVSASGELPNTPANRISLTPQYTWVFDQGKLTMSGTYIWRDQQYGSIFNEPYYIAPSWSQVNLRLSWVAPGDRYEVILFGNNIFNTIDYATGASASTIGNVGVGVPLTTVKSYQIEAPTTFGLELHYKFF